MGHNKKHMPLCAVTGRARTGRQALCRQAEASPREARELRAPAERTVRP